VHHSIFVSVYEVVNTSETQNYEILSEGVQLNNISIVS
jgi:hypothetical protein